jgi:iron complex outermembrane receptor protein
MTIDTDITCIQSVREDHGGQPDANAARTGGRRRVLLSFLRGLAVTTICSVAAAEPEAEVPSGEAAPAAAREESRPSASDSGGLDEVVVTAQKRAENMQNVPIAVSAVSGSQLQNIGVRSLTDLNVAVPSMNVTNSYGRLIFSVRGIGSTNVGPGTESPIALYIDGVYYASTTASLLSLNNIDHVEVLKGPQGTLFGRNATGGLVQVVTKDPTSTGSGSFALTYGNYDTQIGSAYLAGGITDNLAANVAVYAKRQGEGWGVDRATGSQLDNVDHDISVRSKWVLTPTDQAKLTLIGDYESVRDTMLTTALRGGTISSFIPGVIQPDLGRDNNNNFNSRHGISARGISLRWDQQLGELSFASITAFRAANTLYGGDLDALPVVYTSFQWTQFDRQFTQELQLSSNLSERFKWTSGVYYYGGTAGLEPSIINLNYAGIHYDYPTSKEGMESEAAYLQGTYEVFDATDLTLGGRYTREVRKAYDEVIRTYGIADPISTATYTYVPPDSKHFYNFSYRASLDHRFSDQLLAYASYNTGFKAGGFNVGSPGTPSYDPEKLNAAEIGLKTDLFDRHARFNIAAYYYTYDNIQVQSYTTLSVVTVNGAKARSYGIDADLTAVLAPGLQLNTGVTAQNPTFTSFPNCVRAAPLGGVALFPGSCSGNQLGAATKITFNAALDYAFALGGGTMDLNGNAYYNGGYFTDVSNVIHQPAYTRLAVSARWTAPDGRTSIRGYGSNLTNRRVLLYGDSQGLGTQLVNYGEPRTYGVTIAYDF